MLTSCKLISILQFKRVNCQLRGNDVFFSVLLFVFFLSLQRIRLEKEKEIKRVHDADLDRWCFVYPTSDAPLHPHSLPHIRRYFPSYIADDAHIETPRQTESPPNTTTTTTTPPTPPLI